MGNRRNRRAYSRLGNRDDLMAARRPTIRVRLSCMGARWLQIADAPPLRGHAGAQLPNRILPDRSDTRTFPVST